MNNTVLSDRPEKHLAILQIGRTGSGAQMAAAAANHGVESGFVVSLVIHKNYRDRVPIAPQVNPYFVSTFRMIFGVGVPDPVGLLRVLGIVRALSKEKPIWYFPLQHFFNPVVHRFLPRSAHRIVSVHETGTKAGEKNGFARFLFRDEVKHASVVVAHSEAVATELRSYGVDVGCIAPLSPFQFGPRPPKPAVAMPHPGPLRLLMYGRLHSYKGVDLLLDAVELANADSPESVHLTLLGHSADAELNIGDHSRAMVSWQQGYVDDATLGEEIRMADVLVAPYRSATQSGVVASAYAELRPVIVTNVGGLPGQVLQGVTGLIVEPDAHSLAKAIDLLAQDRDLISRMSRAIYQYRSRLGWDWLTRVSTPLGTSGSMLESGRRSP